VRIRARLHPAAEDGFTLIECLVASVLLVVGLLGTFAMVDQANSADGASASRESATNIGREFLETVRGDAYASVTSALLTTELQGMPGYQSGSSPAVIRRRNIDYTVTSSVLSIDDPKDGLASSTPPDNQPDDLKRITTQVSWSGRRAGTLSMTAMLSSSGAKIGIKINTFTMTSPASTTIDTTTTATQAVFSATATGASKIIFAVDGTDQPSTAVTPSGTCTGATCTKQFTWNFSSLSDGVYRITARTVDGSGVEGQPTPINVTINKNQRTAPCGVGSTATTGAGCLPVEGGYNYLPGTTTPIFELRWQANPQRNVIGYKVVQNGSNTPICSTDAQGNVTFDDGQPAGYAAGLESYACVDTSPPAPSTTPTKYDVYAVYANPSTGAMTNGPTYTVSQAGQGASSTTFSTVTKTFGMDPVTVQPAGCTDNLTDGFTGTTANSIPTGYGPGTFTWCMPPIDGAGGIFPTATSVQVQNTVSMSITGNMNSSKKTETCTVSWDVLKGVGGASIFPATGRATLTLVGGGALQQALANSDVVSPTPQTIPSGTKLALAVTLTGSNCASPRATILYGGQSTGVAGMAAPGSVTVEFYVGTPVPGALFSRPNPPTALSKVASGSDMQIKWSGPAPSGGNNVAFYRIYRDGQTYDRRYDTCDVGDLTSAGGCDNGNNTFTYTDQNTGGTAHTYWVTAVYGTSTTATMAESTLAAVP
jgi:prepilin-type N-terminal cleavage/methylation domain-containing protein